MNQRKKGYHPTPYRNTTKSFPRKDLHSNPLNAQGSRKIENLGEKRFGDNFRKTLKCGECGEPHLRRKYPCLSSTNRIFVHNLQEASIVGDMGRSLHQINAVVDEQKADH
jgi:hypothetical protein